MALVVKDRVQENSTTTGTGTLTLSGAVSGFQTFSSAIGNTNTTYYAIVNNTEWEVGIGTVGVATLSRDTILESSNGGTAVNFSAGTKNVFVTYPAEKGIYLDASGNAIALGTPASATLTNATGLPISTGISGFGTSVASALAINVGSSGALVANGGSLGTPSSGTATNLTGLPISTGVSGLGTGVATFLATPSSANLASALTDETGTGANVFANTPTLVTPILGTPTSGTLTSCTGLPLTTGVTGTLPVANGGTGITSLTANYIPYGAGTSNFASSANLTFNGTTFTANTIGAFTLGGTVAGGGNQINNVIIGTSTPLAGSFTTLSASGVSTFSAGTAALPAITTTGDTNTGIFFPAADTIAFSEGGTESMRIDSSGNVAINGTYISPFTLKNYIINGNFDIWQRGTTNTRTTYGYTVADRWQYITDGTLNTGTVFSQQTFTTGQTDVPNNPTYYLQWQFTSVNTPSNYIRQRIENVRTLSGKTATISAWVRCTSGTISFLLAYQQEFGTGGSPSGGVYPAGTSFTATTTWTKYTATFNVNSISGKTIGTNNDSAINIAIAGPSSGSGTLQIAQVQVENGSNATQFEFTPIQQTLALCQRYYWRQTSVVSAGFPYPRFGQGVGTGGTSLDAFIIHLPVTMRTAPTVTFSNNLGVYDGSSTSTVTGSVNANDSQTSILAANIVMNYSPTAGKVVQIYSTTSGQYMAADAEL